MTATLISFPTLQERDDTEFDRTGANRFTRAGEEAYSLWETLTKGRTDDLTGRIDALDRELGHMARYRADSLEDLIILDDGGRMALSIMPNVLKTMMRCSASSKRAIGER